MSLQQNNAIQELPPVPRLRFNLLPFFQAPVLDLINQTYFEYNANSHFSPRKAVKYPSFHNIYVENELKGYIQHLVIDQHLKASTISFQAGVAVPRIEFFFAQFYPNANSVVDVPYEELYPKYLEYLSDCGFALTYHTSYHPTADLGFRRYEVKADIVFAFARFYRFVYDTAYPDLRKEKEKDCWDIRRLGIPYSTAIARPRYCLNFSVIKQDWLRGVVKEYCFYRLQNRTMSAVIDDLKGLKNFSEFLSTKCPEIDSLLSVSRKDIEEYFSYLSAKGFVTTTYNRRISILRTFFTLGSMLDMEGFPLKPLVLLSDYRKAPSRMPRYYSPSEIERINAHLGELPIQIARMLFVLENCGLRLSDLCSATINIDKRPSLVKNNSNEFVFTYFMPKTHRYNTIPVSEVVGEVLAEAIAESRSKFGEECNYIFAMSKDHPISTEVFNENANRMAAKNHLVKDDGTPLRIRGHAFRSTLATEYANSGISLDIIRMMLGQRSMKVLDRYVQIHDVTMVEAMRPLTDENERLIKSIGRENSLLFDQINEPALIPLSNGRCSKAVDTGICKHAELCYSCNMFVPCAECIPVYRKQLSEAKANISIAEIHGFERIKELNEQLVRELTAILKRLGIDT